MAIPARPRFHAIMWGQILGIIIIIAGMIFHWLGFGEAIVPRTITYRVITIVIVMIFTVAYPIWKNSSTLEEIGSEEEVTNRSKFYDEPENVQFLLWACLFIDLILLTYLVHITGGLTGSMYAGMYLMLPSVALLLRNDARDTYLTVRLIAACFLGLLLSFLMSHFGYVEYDASKFPHAYDKALGLVSLLAVALPMAQTEIVKAQERKQRTGAPPR